MGFVNAGSENTLMSNNNRWNYKIENVHTDTACRCIIATTNGAMYHYGIKKTILILLHSSTFVYTRQVTHQHSSSDLSTLV